MVDVRIDLEISNNRVDDLVVRSTPTSEHTQFPLKNEEQLLDVAVFLAQDFNDHCALLEHECS